MWALFAIPDGFTFLRVNQLVVPEHAPSVQTPSPTICDRKLDVQKFEMFCDQELSVDLLEGWYEPEDWGGTKAVWMGRNATFAISCPVPKLIRLQFAVHPHTKGENRLKVLQGAEPIVDERVEDVQVVLTYVSLAPGKNILHCHLDGNLFSPSMLGISDDSRVLGCAFTQFELTPLIKQSPRSSRVVSAESAPPSI